MSAGAAAAELTLAQRLADLADSISLPQFRAADLEVQLKPDHTPVTEADRRIESEIRELLQRERPAHAVAGEEFGTSGDAAMRWYIDPIDGTKNFARGIPVWATLIALYDGDIPVCGVVSAPALHARWWAAAGAGATSSHRGALQVSTVRELAAAGVSCSDIREFEQHGFGSGFATLSQGCAHVRAFGDFWSHMLVAEGALELGVEPVVNAWDVAPIRCIVEEAGGVFTDLQGRRDITGGSVLTSNGVLHQAALQLLANTITR